jgi:exodeoxyribonuclease-5
MILTNKQEEGLKVAVARFKAGEPWTCISGYAGSGKSTLVKFIISALKIPEDEVCYVAYTGKAATVLRQKGCPNAMTAHKLLYWSSPTPSGKFIFKPRLKLENPCQIIVVDEISMLPKTMWELLLRHKVYVLALGDPEQLPPIDKDEDNHVLDNPHIFLDEIMRQAQESEIIRLSMHVREGKPLNTFEATGAQVQIFSPSQVISGMYSWADQILCATNAKRMEINNYVRKQKGFNSVEPQIGDKIISLRNHWGTLSASGFWALTNGAIGTITNYNIEKVRLPFYITNEPVDYMMTDISLDDDDVFIDLPIDYKYLKTGETSLSPKQTYLVSKNDNCKDAPFEFDYAYAITTHKSQGSEWDKVLIFEEGFPYKSDEHRRWLYTAITRAREKVVIITGV